MPIEDVFSIEGRGTVATGRIERGIVNLNDEVEMVGLGDTKKTVVTGIEMFNKQLDKGMAGDNAGLLLRGLKKEEVERGMVLAKPGSVTRTPSLKRKCTLLPRKRAAATSRSSRATSRSFYIRTTDVTGEVELPAGVEMVMPGDTVNITVKLITPVRVGRENAFRHPRGRQDRRRRAVG